MLNINLDFLKSLGFCLAEDLGIHRPTVEAYANAFEDSCEVWIGTKIKIEGRALKRFPEGVEATLDPFFDSIKNSPYVLRQLKDKEATIQDLINQLNDAKTEITGLRRMNLISDPGTTE